MASNFFSGPASSFPGKETWLDFDTLFNLNKTNIIQTGDSGSDVNAIFNAIEQASAIIEARIILCIILQESHGDVGVITTGGTDAGIMQCDGSPGFPGQQNLSQVCSLLKYGIRLELTRCLRIRSHPWSWLVPTTIRLI
jgi:hypothetical protein